MGAMTSPSALPGARKPEDVLPPVGVPEWHPERTSAPAEPLSLREEELWAQLLER